MIEQNIRIIVTEGIFPRDISCDYATGDVTDTVTLTNTSGKELHNIRLILTLDDSEQKKDTISLWSDTASQTYQFRLGQPTRKIRIGLLCDEGRLEYEYEV